MPKLVFGGTFNPIHYGHLRCAQAVAEREDFDRVVLIPSAQPPHKPDTADVAPAADRLAMCQLAAEGNELFEVCDIEMRRGGPSYTIDTAQELLRQGWETVHWLIGADMLLYLPKWHRPLKLLSEVDFVIMARPGFTIDWSLLPGEFRQLQKHVVEAPLVDISGTDIRHRIRAGEPIDHLVPEAVAQYIGDRRLYRS